MIAIIDYGVGNLESVYKALESLGFESKITRNIDDINKSDAIILPGVGAFKDAIENLRNMNLVNPLMKNIKKGKPLLGICLGMQLLYEESLEDGKWKGLGFFKGSVVKFKGDVKIPHMGWNNLNVLKKDNITKYINENDYVYFVHSYYAKGEYNDLIATTDYKVDVPAIVRKGNVIGMQFHPEKSGKVGLSLLKAFGEMIK
ncbi:MAG: imidazole glycerol phosphate synthase subunit HisH [Firmicutes bacterium]|nr:imidazole glycerol phosphate synthase subunit HisH [Bacillota bacterium]